MNEANSGIPPEARPPRLPILWLCVLLSFACLAIGFLVWVDNKVGFRDADAFSQLLAAVFGMISVIWLAGAVLLQREELTLQRHELGLQRLEVKRLADAAEEQRAIFTSQETIDRKNNIANNVRNILTSHELGLSNFIIKQCKAFVQEDKRVRKLKRSYDLDNFDISIDTIAVNFRYSNGRTGRAKFKYYDFHKYLASLDDFYVFKVLTDTAKNCKAAELLDWFKKDLPFYMDPIEGLAAAEVFLILHAAAHFER